MLKMKILDIVIPTFNRKDALERTLNSIVPYLDGRMSVTVIDNASTNGIEGTKQLFSGAGIKFVSNEFNVGPTLNYIKCLGAGDSPYVWVICDDDECDFQGLSDLCDYLSEGAIDVLMVGHSVGRSDYFSSQESKRIYGETIAEAYSKNKDNIAFSFGFVPSLLYRRNLIGKEIFEKLTARASSYYPQVWLQCLIQDATFSVYKKPFIKKPGEVEEVPKLLHYQASWVEMSWEIYNESKGLFDLQRIIFPSLFRGTLRLVDGAGVNISHEGVAKTIYHVVSIIIFLRGRLKIAAVLALLAAVILGKKLRRVRQYVWRSRLLRTMLMSKG